MSEPEDIHSDPPETPLPESSPRPAPSGSRAERWLDAFFSLLPSYWLAVALLALILVVTATATIFEAKVDAGFARYMVYDRGWFEFLLLLLGVNLAAAALSRWPWKRRHVGFLVTHFGLIVVLAGSAVGRYFGWEGQLVLMEGETGSEVRTSERLLRIATPWETRITGAEFHHDPPTPAHPFRLELGDYAVTVDRYYPLADIEEAIERDPERGGPAAKVRFTSQFGTTETWLLLNVPLRDRHEVGPARIRFVQARTDQELRKLTAATGVRSTDYRVRGLAGHEARNVLTIVRAPDGSLHYVVRSATGAHRTGPIELQQEIPLPWMHETRFRVEEYLEDGVLSEQIVPVTSGDESGSHLPALHAVVRKGSEVGEGWAWWGAVHGTGITVGHDVVNLAYYNRTIPLKFDVRLLDFRDVPNPGGAGIASFESDVEVLDAPRRLTRQATISMNRPLKYEGLLLCQSSYIKARRPGEGDISVLSASSDPGVPIVYAGFVLVMVGIAVTFYAKPRRSKADGGTLR